MLLTLSQGDDREGYPQEFRACEQAVPEFLRISNTTRSTKQRIYADEARVETAETPEEIGAGSNEVICDLICNHREPGR